MNPKKPRTPCPACGKEPARSFYKYCSNACQQEIQRKDFLTKWKNGTVSGLNGQGLVSMTVKKYLRRKYKDKCCLCEWSKVNTITGVVPLVADHIDGNWRNNRESNLRLICPNCDSLSPTFSALNKGKGRPNRPADRRSLEARQLRKSSQR